MLVVLPTYQRLSSLRWVLYSLFSARLPVLTNAPRLVVVNNYLPDEARIEALVQEMSSHHGRWQIRVLSRPFAMGPAESWYAAISTLAEEDEVVFLQGDDDLLTPWSLTDRYEAIRGADADFLLSKASAELFFLPDGQSIRYLGEIPTPGATRAEQVFIADFLSWGPGFIGAHTYRNRRIFRNAIAKVFSWSDEQTQLAPQTRRLMIPLHLPTAVVLAGGRVAGLESICMLRGQSLSEVERARFGTMNWNFGILKLSALALLNNRDLGGLEALAQMRSDAAHQIFAWALPMLWDRRVSLRDIAYLLPKTKLHRHWREAPQAARTSLRRFFGEALQLRGRRLAGEDPEHTHRVDAFLEAMAAKMGDEARDALKKRA